MKSNFTPGRILVIAIAVLLLAVVAGVLLPGEHTTEQAVERSFTIDEDFTKVRKIMVRTNAAKEIVTMGGDSEFIEQRWEDGSAELGGEKIGQALLRSALSEDPDWKLELRGTLKVRLLDDTIGHEVIELQQKVEIVPDRLQSHVKLKRGTERLLGYTMNTTLVRAEDHTRVELELRQKIKLDLPWFAHGIASRRVRAAAEKSLANQDRAIRQLLKENADKAGLFPLR
jgi:hypothetical protein